MTTVVWIPGLRGIKDLRSGFTASARPHGNENVVHEGAVSERCSFRKIDYQTVENPTPLLSDMSSLVANRLADIIRSRKDPLVIVSSSVGAGVTLGALSQIKQTVSPIALLALKPVFDPLKAISLQIKNRATLDQLFKGTIASLPLPVEGDAKDVFPLSRDHLLDPCAPRVLDTLSNFEDAQQFSLTLINAGVKEITLVYGDNDHLTPKALVDEFTDNVRYIPIVKRRIHGNHASDFRRTLREELDNLIALANDFS